VAVKRGTLLRQAKIKKETKIMTTSYSLHKKMETQNKKSPTFPVMTLPHNASTTITKHTAQHLTVILEASYHNYSFSLETTHIKIYHAASLHADRTPSHTPSLPRYYKLHFATTAKTGMNSVRARTLLEPSRRLPRRRKCQRSEQNKKMPK